MMFDGFRQIKTMACLRRIFAVAVWVWLNAGCGSDKDLPDVPEGDQAIFIVCEGNYGASNASLDIIDTFDTDTIHRNVFNRVNGSKLGGYAHRMLILDTIGMVVVTAYHHIKAIHTRTYELLHTIPVRSPRDVVFSDGSVFISSYMDSQIIIAQYPSWEIQSRIKIGHKPNHLAVAAGKIFISNSDTLFTKKLQDSVITIMEALPPYNRRAIALGKTPSDLIADPHGERVYIACKGSASEPGSIMVLDAQNEEVVQEIGRGFNIRPVQLALHDSLLACVISENGYVRVFNNRTGLGEGLININASSVAFCGGDLLIADAFDYMSPGRIYMLDGKYAIRRIFRTGTAPAHIVCRP